MIVFLKEKFFHQIKCTPQARKSFLNEYKSGDLWINHNNIVQIFARKNGEKIIVSVFDILGLENIKIIIDPEPNCSSKLEKNDRAKNPNVSLEEKCLEQTRIIHFYAGFKEEQLQVCNIKYHKIISTNFVMNPLGKNFNNLPQINALKIGSFDIYNEFKNLKIQEQKSQLSEIVETLGFPHSVVSLTEGYQMFLFFGIHKCKESSSCSLIMVKTNRFHQIVGIYKMINFCNQCSAEKNNITSNEDINYS